MSPNQVERANALRIARLCIGYMGTYDTYVRNMAEASTKYVIPEDEYRELQRELKALCEECDERAYVFVEDGIKMCHVCYEGEW